MNGSQVTRSSTYTCPKCGFFSEQPFAYCPNCGTAASASATSSEASVLKVIVQVILGLIALSMTGFSVIMSFIIMAASGTNHISEWGLQIGLFPNLISAVCIGGIIFLNRVMR